MAISFDASNKRIILDSNSVSAIELYSRAVEWSATNDNIKYGPIFQQVGSEDLGSGLSIPPYFFLQGNWKIRPMELDHDLTITGNLFTIDGSVPVVKTLGNFQVNVKYVVPVLAQGISTSGSTLNVQDITNAILAGIMPDISIIKSNTALIPALL